MARGFVAQFASAQATKAPPWQVAGAAQGQRAWRGQRACDRWADETRRAPRGQLLEVSLGALETSET